MALLALVLIPGCADEVERRPEGEAHCEIRTCDGWVDPPHEAYELCVTCDAATDTCALEFIGEDGEAWYTCTWSADDACQDFYDAVPAYCSPDGYQ